MSVIVLRYSAVKVKKENKMDAVTASQLKHATGYTLNKVQLASIKLAILLTLSNEITG